MTTAAGSLEHPTSGILSLIFGILGLVLIPVIGAILALVFGYQCRRDVAAEPGRYRDDFGKVGRVLGWIGLALAVLGVLVLVAFFGILAASL